jgi:hypothetical protein
VVSAVLMRSPEETRWDGDADMTFQILSRGGWAGTILGKREKDYRGGSRGAAEFAEETQEGSPQRTRRAQRKQKDLVGSARDGMWCEGGEMGGFFARWRWLLEEYP